MASFSFVMALRNRKSFALPLLNENMSSIGVDHEILVVEDQGSDDCLCQHEVSNGNVHYRRVDTGIKTWNKPVLLNVGIRNATKDFYCILDSDARFDHLFWERMSYFIDKNPGHSAYRYNFHQKDTGKYTYYWFVIPMGILRGIRGMDESLFLWGGDDDNVLERLPRNGNPQVNVTEYDSSLIAWHEPHSDKIRNPCGTPPSKTGMSNLRLGRENVRRYTSALNNQPNWGLCQVTEEWIGGNS